MVTNLKSEIQDETAFTTSNFTMYFITMYFFQFFDISFPISAKLGVLVLFEVDFV